MHRYFFLFETGFMAMGPRPTISIIYPDISRSRLALLQCLLYERNNYSLRRYCVNT